MQHALNFHQFMETIMDDLVLEGLALNWSSTVANKINSKKSFWILAMGKWFQR